MTFDERMSGRQESQSWNVLKFGSVLEPFFRLDFVFQPQFSSIRQLLISEIERRFDAEFYDNNIIDFEYFDVIIKQLKMNDMILYFNYWINNII